MSILTKILWAFGRLLPVDRKKIVLSCFYGRGCSDSPKAIAEALHRKDPSLKLICLTDKKHLDNIPEYVTPKSYGIFSRVYHLSTAKVWIDNTRKGAGYKKKDQFYLQTWHGFALKRIEQDAAGGREIDRTYAEYGRRDSAQTDLYISGSRHMTEIYRRSFWYHGQIAQTGTPRNDILFRKNDEIRQKVYEKLGLDSKRRLILYAPTFRADHNTDCYRLDCAAVLAACEERFGGDWTVLVRLHPSVDALSASLFSYDGDTVVDVTHYDDVMELLCCTDLLITDYSSVMFDYALTRRPCVQFATDLEAYKNDRNFYFPIETLPFPRAESNAQLCERIKDYDRTQTVELWNDFAERYGLCEDGQASDRCADLILERMNQ